MAEQKSRLVIEISTENAKRNAELLNQEIQKLTEKGDKASASSSALGKELKTTGESAKTLGDSTSKATKELAQQESQLNKNGTAVVQLAKYVASYLTISKAISMADGYTQMAARIKNATANAQEYALVQERLYQTANTTYRSLAEAQEVYLSMSGGMKSLGYNTAQTLDMTDSLSFAFTANATRADQAQSAMDALSKSMAKGKVDADAWISIVTGADNVIADMAKTTGKSEAAIRQLGAEGKISLSDLIKTLIQTKDANEALANNMENSFADGMQKLSNAVTVYFGKANESTSATGIMASALGELADNLDAVADVAILGGVAYLTQAIASQTVAIKASVTSSFAKRAALTAELQSQATLAAVEVQRTRQVVALAATEVNLARAEYSSATTRNARAAATLRLTQAEVAYNIAAKQSTIATVAQTTAQNALNASQAIGTRMLALVGGPIGALTLGVTALAAGYMYMQSRAEEANKKLQDQASVAKKAKEELLALKGLEKDNAVEDMTASFERQNKALSESSSQLNVQLTAIKRLYAGNKEVVQVVDDFQNGTISATDALKKFNELRISKDIYNSLKETIPQFIKHASEAKNSKEKLSLFGVEVELAGRKAQTSVVGVDANSKSLTENEKAAKSAAQAQKDYHASLYDKEYEAVFTQQLLAKGLSEEKIKVILEANQWARKNNVKFTNELAQEALRVYAIEQKNNKVIEDRNKSEQERTKELKEQGKALKLNALVSANAAKANATALETTNKLPRGLLSAVNMVESPNSNSATSGAGAGGPMQFMPATADRYKVDIKNVESSYKGASNYLKDLLKMFDGDLENALRAYNWGEGNMQNYLKYGSGMKKVGGKWQKGYFADKPMPKETREYSGKVMSYMAGASGQSFDSNFTVDDYLKELQKAEDAQIKTQQEIDQLKSEYLTADYRRQQDHEKKVADLKAHGLNDLVAKENAQYKAETELSKLQFESQVYGWQWVGEEKIKNDAKVNKAVIDASKELGDAQKAEQKKSIDAQAEYELAVFRETQRQKINELAFAVGGAGDQARNYLMEKSNPSLYARNQLSSERFGAQSQLNKDYQSQRGEIFNQGLDPEEQHAKLLEAEKQFLDSKQALNEMYAQKETDLQQSQYQNQLQIWGSLLSQGQTMWSQLTQSVKDANGEQSSAYKAALLAQQAFSIASTLVSTHLAAAQVMADPSALTLAQKTMYSQMVLGLGYANAGLIAAQTISGMAHNGIDSVPKEGTWLLDGGERVLNPQQNKDLTSYLANSNRGSSGDVSIQVNITDSGVSTQSSNSDKKQLGDAIGNAVRAVIRQEKRQGGLLY